MRLTENQCAAIVAEVSSLLGPDTKLWLFGSRADDRARGGDIDLCAEVPREVAPEFLYQRFRPEYAFKSTAPIHECRTGN